MHLFLIPAPPPLTLCSSKNRVTVNLPWRELMWYESIWKKKNCWPTVVELPCLCFLVEIWDRFFFCFVPFWVVFLFFCFFFGPFTISLVFNVYSSRDSRTLSTLVKLRIIVSLLIRKKKWTRCLVSSLMSVANCYILPSLLLRLYYV